MYKIGIISLNMLILSYLSWTISLKQICDLYVCRWHTSRRTLLPGPDIEVVLSLQHQHQFTKIWEENDTGLIRIRYHYHMQGWTSDGRIKPYVVLIGQRGVSCLGTMNIVHASVTALMEQWCQEKKTFHLPVGEATEDVEVLSSCGLTAI